MTETGLRKVVTDWGTLFLTPDDRVVRLEPLVGPPLVAPIDRSPAYRVYRPFPTAPTEETEDR